MPADWTLRWDQTEVIYRRSNRLLRSAPLLKWRFRRMVSLSGTETDSPVNSAHSPGDKCGGDGLI